MTDISKVIKLIETATKGHFQEVTNENGKPVNSIANLGAKKGERAKLERNGEYYGIAVEFLEDVKRLLTDKFVIRILRLMEKENYITVMNMLDIITVDQIHYVLNVWCMVALDGYDGELEQPKKEYHEFDEWIGTERSMPLLGRIKVTDIGQNKNTGDSVVPVDWLGREFANGAEMHAAMDKLDWRIGKPPVTYAIIYSMRKQKIETHVAASELAGVKNKLTLYVTLKDDKLTTVTSKGYKDGYTYVVYGDLFIGFVLDNLLTDKSDVQGGRDVSVLVSRLQKCIRRGRYARKILDETVDRLNECPNYNLPEHGFMRVSASKQLVWRLFISIMEDCRPYTAVNELSLLDLIALTLITNRCLEYKFTPALMKLIKLTAVLAQFNDTTDDLFDWRAYDAEEETVITKSDYHNSISIALTHIIMMKGDNGMLRKLYSAKDDFPPFKVPTKIYHDQAIYDNVLLASIDHHCTPHIILYYQACIAPSKTTKEISSYIWTVSSGYNVRGTKVLRLDHTLRQIQKYIAEKPSNNFVFAEERTAQITKHEPDGSAKRSSFLILFGKKYRFSSKEVVMVGDSNMPIKIKINNVWTPSDDILAINALPPHTVRLTKISPPFGYQWAKDAVHVKMHHGYPMIDDAKVPFFDGSSILKSNTPKIKKFIKDSTYRTIIAILSGAQVDFETVLALRKKQCKQIFNWIPTETDMKKVNIDLVKSSYIKIFNQIDNLIMIGPVDRMGHKIANSISYVLEGRIWAVFNMLTYLYPDTLKPSGTLNFVLNKSTCGYVHMVMTLEKMCMYDVAVKSKSLIPKIVTPLWEHQIESVDRIVADFNKGFHGRGDASDVGSGKTLTSLAVAARLIEDNDSVYRGILIMLPGPKLIKTWEDELAKHTKNFDIKYQGNNANIGKINNNTIVISTMAKVRDHRINHHWLLVVIDECLTVQNKNALQTEEAWRQSLMSKHLLLMSATFFRTRFDKLYYMLKMLQTGLPETKDYLDTILSESIVSKVATKKRKWHSNINYFELDKASREEYEEINRRDISTEAKYSKLNSYLISSETTNIALIEQLGKLIKKMERAGHRCLIYARAKDEAEAWSTALNIGIYPNKTKHVIVTYNEGVYGLNDLVIYDTIVIKPSLTADKIVQAKGRLDRPGQQKNELHIEYFVFKSTIDEGLIIRMNMCNQFVKSHIMPLSKFYDVSVNFEEYI